MIITTRDPADMTGQERMQEIATILAGCILRIENNKKKQCDNHEFERSLTGLPTRRKHSCDHAEKQRGDE